MALGQWQSDEEYQRGLEWRPTIDHSAAAPRDTSGTLARTRVSLQGRSFAGMFQNVSDSVQFELERLGRRAADMARRLCPVDTGFLKSTINSRLVGTHVSDLEDAVAARPGASKVFRALNARPGRMDRLRTAGVLEYPGGPGGPLSEGFAASRDVEVVDDNGESARLGSFAFAVQLRADAWYAGAVEFGHIAEDGTYVAPKPFLTPAIDSARRSLPYIVAAGIENGARKSNIGFGDDAFTAERPMLNMRVNPDWFKEQ